MEKEFIEMVNKSLEIGKDSVEMDEKLQDNPRFDSLGILMVLLKLEEDYSVIISSDDMKKFNTVRDLYTYTMSNKTK